MPRTSPTVDGSGNYREITLKWIDANNGKRSDTYRVSAAATDAQIEAIVVAAAAASNANNYQVRVAMVYNSIMSPSDAIEESRVEVSSNIVLLFKDSAGNARDWFLPAPLDSMFTAGTNNPNPLDTLLGNWETAIDAAIETGFEPVTLRYTSRRKKNPSVPVD